MPTDKKTSISANTMSPLNTLLGMTPTQERQNIIDQGLDQAAEIEAMRRLGRVLAAKFAPQIQREEAMRPEFTKSFSICDEAVAAGTPAWADCSAPSREASLFDFLAGATPKQPCG